ncbi:hypothetical protein [Thiothrix sp.]|jgi:hypothetical protein|uniref:hypothetical protein n=1 Tax=Thiothrix sp. TaxID=1032 RepID=UPI00257ADE96|nr:hypothetical protein [Thiothrix sp.]
MCGGGGGGGGGDGGAAANEAARKAEVAARIADINKIFDENAASGIYKQGAGNVLALDRNYLDQQRADSERMNRFALSRQGLAGGSQDVDRQKALLDTYNRGMLQAGTRSDKMAADWAGQDEDLRNSLIRQVTADPAAFNAAATHSQLTSAAESRKNSGIDSTLGNLFSQFADTYSLSRYNAGAQSVMGNGGYSTGGLPTVSSSRNSYQGR